MLIIGTQFSSFTCDSIQSQVTFKSLRGTNDGSHTVAMKQNSKKGSIMGDRRTRRVMMMEKGEEKWKIKNEGERERKYSRSLGQIRWVMKESIKAEHIF